MGNTRLLLVGLVICGASVSQVLATQLTAAAFRDTSFASPVSLTWFSMHGLMLLVVPWFWQQQQQRANGSGEVPVADPSRVRDEPEENEDNHPQRAPAADSVFVAMSMIDGRHVSANAGCIESNNNHEGTASSAQRGSPSTSTTTSTNRTPLLQAYEAALVSASPMLSSLKGLARILFLYALYVAANVSYVKALQGLAPALVSAIFCAAPGFVLFLSWPVLGRRVEWMDAVSVVCGFAGILLITQPWGASVAPSSSNGDGSSTGTTALYATISPAASAVYKVFFCKFYANASWQYVGTRLGALSVANITFGTLMLVVYLASGGEPNPTADAAAIPWGRILPANGASIAFNFLVNYGVTITFPLYVSIASLVSTAVNLVLDATVVGDGGGLDAAQWGGLLLVVASLMVLLGSVWYRDRRRRRVLSEAEVAEDAE